MNRHPEAQSGLIIPPSARVTMAATRRNFLRSAAAGGAVLTAPGLLSACSSDSGGGSGGGGGSTGTVTFGANEAKDSGPAYQRMKGFADAWAKKSGDKVTGNYVDHNTFQENINTYLQGSPDDVFTWFAGYRMQQFAEDGLLGDLTDLWPIDGMSDAFKEASTSSDDKQYLVPYDYYPWAMFYNKEVFDKNKIEEPATLDDFIEVCKTLQGKGITPVAFGDKDGWPAMGTFDILNMRINGFDFHMSLMHGEEAWDSSEVKAVFSKWAELLTYHQADPLGRTWQEAATSMGKGECAMYLLGTFVGDAIPDDVDNIDFFTFPEIDSSIGADALDAPIDGFCLSSAAKNPDEGKKMLAFLGTAEAQDAANNAADAPMIAANANASTKTYSALQLKSVEVVNAAAHIAQFLDRDTNTDFASTVMIPSIQTFLKKPDDIDGLTKSIQEQKVSIFGS
ncbi:MAG: substrate-binding domain-containing protein [Nocardioides sp.]|uniref:ABC transporter substrate-binding protein n=1 Tax=Nocardioides sp. TaxID=35761 RepID=UPI0039E4C4CF